MEESEHTGAGRRMKNYAKRAAKRIRRVQYIQKIKKLKTYALFIAMMAGIVLSPYLVDVRWITNLFVADPGHPIDITHLTTYTLFAMLFITYCKVSPRQMKFEKMHLWLLAFQWVGCWIAYGALVYLNKPVAAGVFVCLLASTATSAPVITGMLGGSVPRLATYCIFTNLSIAIIAPLYFSFMGVGAESGADSSFVVCFLSICRKVIPLALGPFFLAIIVKRIVPGIHQYFQTRQIISFWLWCFSLVLLMARTMGNLMTIESKEYAIAGMVAIGALAVCCLQFFVGRRIGRHFGDPVVGGQSLGQKNTILAIWMAQKFLDPTMLIVSIAPASYVLWQNIINSWQIWRYNRQKSK